MLRLHNISFHYEDSTYGVSDIDFSVNAGECVVLMGTSGCGKTTITRLVNALAPAYYPGSRTGKITVNDKDISSLPAWEVGRIVGSVFQDPRRQFFSSELRGEVAFACENYGLPQHEIRRRTDNAIRRMELEHLANRSLDVLSGGEKQRTAIASVYAIQPAVFVLDEPTANLDDAGIRELRNTLLQLKEEGCALLAAEHRLSWLDGLADRYIYMVGGRIEGIYTPAEMRGMEETERMKKGLRAVFQTSLQPCAPPVSGNPPAIRAENLLCRRGKTTIWQSLTTEASRGQITAITGRNGIGKTTMALALSGLMRFQGGCVRINGVKMSSRKLRQQVYFCSNDTGTQFFTGSVSEELLLNKERTEKNLSLARELLDRMKLSPWKDSHPATLSSGQRQRLAVACALLSDKDILILDEPTSGLDGRNMRLIAGELRSAAQSGKTILVITHDEELIDICCDYRIKLDEANKVLKCF